MEVNAVGDDDMKNRSCINLKEEIKQAYDFIVEDYDDYMKRTNHTNAQRRIIELLKSEIDGEVIDIGTGTGIIAITVAKKIPNSRVTGIDLSEKMIEGAKSNAEENRVSVDFLVNDAEQINFPDKKFDIVMCCLGMLWFVNKEMVLKEMMRICKNSGKIILIEEEGKTLRSTKKKSIVFNERLLKFFSKIEKLETHISLKEIIEKMHEYNWDIKKRVNARIDQNHGFVGMVFEVIK